ncbi:MAG: aldehyde dehydrogenase family protein [Chitinophagaceae bacterium]|nr:aldehyde dehydrogenase family protein [Chitinophagaceae bacterium]
MIPVFLELGGKDPAIVLAGADVDKASSAILWGSTANAGQSCLSIEHVYVQQTIFDAFVKQLVEKAQHQKIAYPTMDSGSIAPIIFEKQAHIINEHLKDAIDKGAIILCGAAQCEEHGGRLLFTTYRSHQCNTSNETNAGRNFWPCHSCNEFSNKRRSCCTGQRNYLWIKRRRVCSNQ